MCSNTSQTRPNPRFDYTKLGFWISAIYATSALLFISAAIYFGWISIKPIEINALGDFLAGILGPLGILWLVLGFLQQGQELEIQARELALSVEQQAHLARVTDETLKHERSLVEAREKARKRALQPRLIFDERVEHGDNGVRMAYLVVTNIGSPVLLPSLKYAPEDPSHPGNEGRGLKCRDVKPYVWARNGDIRWRVDFDDDRLEHSLVLKFDDMDNETHRLQLRVRRQTGLLAERHLRVDITHDPQRIAVIQVGPR